MARELGDKLGPRLSRLMLSHTLAMRKALAPIEARIGAAAAQQVIDRAGHEVAALYRELYQQVQAKHPQMSPWMTDYISSAAAGTDQWQALAGNLAMTSVTGGLGTILSNELAPAVQAIVALNPNLHIDQNTAAAAVAAQVITRDDGAADARQAGFDDANFEALYQLAQAVPGAPELYALYNRGLIRHQDLIYWLGRSAIPPTLIDGVSQLSVQLLAPADAALAVLRGNMSTDDGYKVAEQNGITRADFDILIGNTGEPPALEEMLMLWRRGQMDTPTLERAIRQSRVRDEWIPYMLKLAIEPPSGAEILNALVQGQVDRATAERRWKEAGGDPTWFETAYHATANSPAPVELASMANRGIIPWNGTGPGTVSWEQGFLEGRWKDKWMAAYRAAAEYHPPPREIATLVREGGMTQDEAMAYWREAGLPPALAHEYWQAAHFQRTSRIHELAQGEIVKLYTDKAISKDEAISMLESVRWTKTDAEWLLDIADLAVERSTLEKAIAKISSLFIAHKIDKNAAAAALATLEVPASQAQFLIATWELEAAANVKILSAAEIADAVFYELMPPDEGMAELEHLGYSARDAWYVLSIKIKGPVPGIAKPA